MRLDAGCAPSRAGAVTGMLTLTCGAVLAQAQRTGVLNLSPPKMIANGRDKERRPEPQPHEAHGVVSAATRCTVQAQIQRPQACGNREGRA